MLVFVGLITSLITRSYPGVAVPVLRTALRIPRTAPHMVQIVRPEGEGWAAPVAVAGTQQSGLNTERQKEERNQHLEHISLESVQQDQRSTYLQYGHGLSPATY